VRLPGSADVGDQHETFGSRVFSVDTRARRETHGLTLRYTYRSLRDALALEELGDHYDALRQARSGVRYRLRADSISAQSGHAVGLRWLGLGVVGALSWGLIRRIAPRRRVAGGHRRRPQGESPADAVVVGGDGEVERQVRSLACACGAAYVSATVERSGFTYDESRMTVAAVQCSGCGLVRHVYFHVVPVQ